MKKVFALILAYLLALSPLAWAETGIYPSRSYLPTPTNLPSGHVFNWNNSDCTLTHSTDTLTLAGCVFALGSATSSNSVDPVLQIVRNVTGTSGNGHAFADNSQVNRSGTIGYNSFDAYVDLLGTSYDHVSGFQARPNINISGTVSTIYGLLTAPVITAGTATTSYGVYLQNPSGAGTLGTDYGIYIGTQTKASTNYPIYSDSANAAIFKGPLNVSYSVNSGSVGLQTLNPSTGTAAFAQLLVGENASSRYLSLSYMNNSFTTSGLLVANRAVLQSASGATNGILIGTAANAPVIFEVNSAEVARLSGSTFSLGADAAAPVAQTMTGANARAGTDTDTAGGDLVVGAGKPTGTGTPGALYLSAAFTGTTSGTGAVALATQVRVNATGAAVRVGKSDDYARIVSTPIASSARVNNSGASETTLKSYTLKFNSMFQNAVGFRVTGWGFTINNGNAKTLRMYYGAALIGTVSLNINSAATWTASFVVLRDSSNAQEAVMLPAYHGTTVTTPAYGYTSGGVFDADDNIIKFTGQATASGDITQIGLVVEYF